MATSLYNAFVNFKRDHDKKSGKQTENQNYVEITDRYTENSSAQPVVDSQTETIQPETAAETKATTTTGVKATDSASISNTVVTAFNNTDVKPVFKVQLLASQVEIKTKRSRFQEIKRSGLFCRKRYV